LTGHVINIVLSRKALHTGSGTVATCSIPFICCSDISINPVLALAFTLVQTRGGFIETKNYTAQQPSNLAREEHIGILISRAISTVPFGGREPVLPSFAEEPHQFIHCLPRTRDHVPTIVPLGSIIPAKFILDRVLYFGSLGQVFGIAASLLGRPTIVIVLLTLALGNVIPPV
jgi:hypothetical protein